MRLPAADFAATAGGVVFRTVARKILSELGDVPVDNAARAALMKGQ
jgi:hypothetical protein